ncbi:MAG TPA: class D sortase [Bryobacteraceae bacterium]|nr:class D sortase [Bryobacteraceae bacterium]
MRNRGWLNWLGSALIVGGAVVLAYYSWTHYQGAVAQKRAKEWLIRKTAAPSRALVPTARRGDVIGELEIPRLQLSVMVFEGDDTGILRQGAGHIPETALLPHSGNIGIAAHRDTYFRPLRGIRANDVIDLKTPAGTSRYTVTEAKIVRPSDVSVLARSPGRDLTLVTCYPFFYVGSAPERFIVHARQIG